ncbi:uncharacterized protein LOC144706335 isoform X2 [Wolffia australiana]
MLQMKLPKISKASGKRLKICIVASAICIVLVVFILGFTVFRPRHAITVVNGFSIGDVELGNTSSDFGVDLNATVLIDISIRNPNHARFIYPSGGTAEIFYRGTLAGVAAIPPGEIGAGETIRTNITLTVLAARLIPNSGSIYADVLTGAVPVMTSTRIAGDVAVLGIFNLHTITFSTCDVIFSLPSRSISSSTCNYKTRL